MKAKFIIYQIFIAFVVFGCQSVYKKKIKDSVEFKWEQGVRPFNEFLGTLEISEKEKKYLISCRYDSYGKITLINHHHSTISFFALKNMLSVSQTYHIATDEGGIASTSLHEPIRDLFPLRRQALASGESMTFYLICKRFELADGYIPESLSPVDSIRNGFLYRIGNSKNYRRDSLVTSAIFLKKKKSGDFVMVVRDQKRYPPEE